MKNFELSDNEYNKARQLIHEYHDTKHEWPSVKYIFSPTGIGNKIEIQIQNESHDITDYERW